MRKPAPSMNDKERVPLEYQTIRTAQRGADRFDEMYARRVREGKFEHLTSRQLWRGRKRENSK
jgi:hypothetical protein